MANYKWVSFPDNLKFDRSTAIHGIRVINPQDTTFLNRYLCFNFSLTPNTIRTYPVEANYETDQKAPCLKFYRNNADYLAAKNSGEEVFYQGTYQNVYNVYIHNFPLVDGTSNTYEILTKNPWYFVNIGYHGGTSALGDYPTIAQKILVAIEIPFSPSEETFSFNSLGGSSAFTVTSQNPWTASTTSDWVSLSQTTGSGDAELTLSVTENAGQDRNATITFTDSESNTFDITVFQKHDTTNRNKKMYHNGSIIKCMYRNGERIYKRMARRPSLIVSDTEIKMDKSGETKTITVTSDAKWTVTTDADWLTITTGGGSFNVTASASSGTREGYVTVVADNGDFQKSITITVKQAQISYLTFTTTTSGSVSLRASGSPTYNPVVYYSYDTEEWNRWDYSALSVPANTSVYIYGDNPDGFNRTESNHYGFSLSGGNFSVSGNIMSLLSPDCESMTTIPCDYCFVTLFCDYCTTLTDASNLLMPATVLKLNCYNNMFLGTRIVDSPVLCGTTLANYCYQGMFANNPSLRTITYCADVAPTSTYCRWWFLGISQSGTFYKTSTAWSTPSSRGQDTIPSNWTIVTQS